VASCWSQQGLLIQDFFFILVVFVLIIPRAILLEHEQLFSSIHRLTLDASPLGDHARDILRVLEPHIQKEEEFAFPPLSLLSMLAKGESSSELESAQLLSETFADNYSDMLFEHKLIVGGLKKLRAASKKSEKTDVEAVVKRFLLHIQLEEEVLYPASIIVGKLRLEEAQIKS
jgi:hypothetical protein